MYLMGFRAWDLVQDLDGVTLPTGIATTEGGQAALAFVTGMRDCANLEWQKLSDEISEHPRRSSTDGSLDKVTEDSAQATPASTTEPSPAKPSNGELFPEG